MSIFIGKNGQQLGPYQVAELSSAIAAGTIALSDLAWSEGEAEWIVLSDYAAKKGIALKPAAPVIAPPGPPPMVAPPSLKAASPAVPPPPPVKDAWFVLRAGQEHGPYTKEAMQQYLADGNLTADDQVRHEDEKDFKPLSSILSKHSVDLNAMAGKAAGIISDLGSKSADMATKAMHNAGPLGEKLKEKAKGKEKLILGGAAIGVLALLVFFLLPGGPSSSDLTRAMERQFTDAGMGAGGVLGANTKVSNLKKLGCKSADQGGYYCQFEYDVEIQMLGTTQKQHQTGSARFVKDSKGWAAVGF
jgi:hypothetical protein